MINNDEQFERSESRTGNKQYSDKKKSEEAQNASSEPTRLDEIINATDNKNQMKDEGMNERTK
jgi:hypothetical protein